MVIMLVSNNQGGQAFCGNPLCRQASNELFPGKSIVNQDASFPRFHQGGIAFTPAAQNDIAQIRSPKYWGCLANCRHVQEISTYPEQT